MSVADEDVKVLLGAILDYFSWLNGARESKHFREVLIDFTIFSTQKGIGWGDMFTFETFREFRKYTHFKKTSHALCGLSAYLHDKGAVARPLAIPHYQVGLPDIYEAYLLYVGQVRGFSRGSIGSRSRAVNLHQYLEGKRIDLASIKIEHLDAFLKEFDKPFALQTRKGYRNHLRGFLKYLYFERQLLRADLAPLLVGPPDFGRAKPPKFCAAGKWRRPLLSLTLETPTQIRTYAMVHLAYTLGLRPVEISAIRLDDISFQRAELTVPRGKQISPPSCRYPKNPQSRCRLRAQRQTRKRFKRSFSNRFKAP